MVWVLVVTILALAILTQSWFIVIAILAGVVLGNLL